MSNTYTAFCVKILKFLHKKCQQRWNRNTNNKLFKVKPLLGEWRPAFRKSRKEQVTITYWSPQTYALFYTRARTATTVLDMPNALHNLTPSP